MQASCEDKERKLQKEMLKGPKEPAVTQEKLRQTTQAKELADIEGKFSLLASLYLDIFLCVFVIVLANWEVL